MRNHRRVLFTGFGLFLVAVFGWLFFVWANFETVEVRGESMLPTYRTGQRLWVTSAYWLVGPIRKNDTIVLRNPETGETIIKRVYALANDEVDELNVPFGYKLGEGPYRVPPNSVYVLGDNWGASQDSRQYGPFPMDAVVGKVIHVRLGF